MFGPPGTRISDEQRIWCISNPSECYASGEHSERVLGEPYVEDPALVGTAQVQEGESAKGKQAVIIGVSALAAVGVLVYIFTKKKR